MVDDDDDLLPLSLHPLRAMSDLLQQRLPQEEESMFKTHPIPNPNPTPNPNPNPIFDFKSSPNRKSKPNSNLRPNRNSSPSPNPNSSHSSNNKPNPNPNTNPSPSANPKINPWGTWEELILASAVKKHGLDNWQLIAEELQSRAKERFFFTAEVRFPCFPALSLSCTEVQTKA